MPPQEDDDLDLDALFDEAEEDMNGGPLPDMPASAAGPVGGFPPPPMEMEQTEESVGEPDDDVMAMLEQIEGGFHDSEGSPASPPSNKKKASGPSASPAAAPSPGDDATRPAGNTSGAGALMDAQSEQYEDFMTQLCVHPCKDLIKVLLKPALPAVLLIESTMSPGTHTDLAAALVDLFDTFKQCPRLMEVLMSTNIRECPSDDVLMRNESLCMRVMRAYLTKVAHSYAHEVMTPLIRKLLDTDLAIEIEPEDHEIPEGQSREECIATAASNLTTLVAEVFDTIEDVERNGGDSRRLPWEIRYIMWVAYSEAKAKFPGAEHHAASSVLFLRLLTPIITMGGKNFKLELDDNLLRQRRRVTTLVGKIVQQIANGVVPQMPQPIPAFSQERIAKNKLFMDYLACSAPQGANMDLPPPQLFTEDDLDAGCQLMVKFCVKHEGKLTFSEQTEQAPGLGAAQLDELQQDIAAAVAKTVREGPSRAVEPPLGTQQCPTSPKAQDNKGVGCCVIC